MACTLNNSRIFANQACRPLTFITRIILIVPAMPVMPDNVVAPVAPIAFVILVVLLILLSRCPRSPRCPVVPYTSHEMSSAASSIRRSIKALGRFWYRSIPSFVCYLWSYILGEDQGHRFQKRNLLFLLSRLCPFVVALAVFIFVFSKV